MRDLHYPTPIEILGPLLAMAAPDQLTGGEIGAVIQDQYMRMLEDFHPLIAMDGVERACKGREFRPSPSAVKEACGAALYAEAQKVLTTTAGQVPWVEGEFDGLGKLPPRERLDYGRRKWCEFFGVDWDAYKACRDDLDKARLLPGWDAMEPNRGEPSQLQLLAESIFTRLPAVLDGQGGVA